MWHGNFIFDNFGGMRVLRGYLGLVFDGFNFLSA